MISYVVIDLGINGSNFCHLSWQLFWPLQPPFRMAANQDRLQVHLHQEVHKGRLSNLAPAQPGRKRETVMCNSDKVPAINKNTAHCMVLVPTG